jgi:hypothetical protein
VDAAPYASVDDLAGGGVEVGVPVGDARRGGVGDLEAAGRSSNTPLSTVSAAPARALDQDAVDRQPPYRRNHSFAEREPLLRTSAGMLPERVGDSARQSAMHWCNTHKRT